MYSTFLALTLAILFLNPVHAGLFVVQPLQGSTCIANTPCTITWVDNGERPLLTAVGVSTVGLYTGHQQLVQTLPPVDVSKTSSVTFTPNPAAGPNSDTYYIAITSTALKGNDSTPYSGWSSFFTLAGMSGSFNSPLASATAPIPIPSSLTLSTSGSIATSTRTIGVLSTAASSTPTARSSTSSRNTSSRLTTVFTSSTPASSVPTASSTSTSTSTPASADNSTATSATVSTPTSTSTSTTTPTAPVSTSAPAGANPVVTSSARGASRLLPSILVLSVATSLLYSILS